MPVSTTGSGLEDGWYRISLMLPVGRTGEIIAASSAIAFLGAQYGGTTASNVRPAGFTGYWRRPSDGKWIRDSISVVTVDVHLDEPLDRGGLAELDQHLDTIKVYLHHYYDQNHVHQDEFWVFVAPEMRAIYVP